MSLKETQNKLRELMCRFDAICRTHDIPYTLHGGTLLGAIREKGFIPWDDDMDVMMTRQAFEKLAAVLTDDPECHIVGKIKKQFRQRGENRYWVDIFICDPISEKPLPQKLKLLLLTVLDVMNRDKNTIALSDFSKYGKGKQIAFKLAYWCGKLLPTDCKCKLYDKASRSLWVGDGTIYVRSNDQYKGRQKVFPARWLDNYTQVPFDDREFFVSTRYHDLLVSFYGENYMTPIKDDRNSVVHDLVRGEGDIPL